MFYELHNDLQFKKKKNTPEKNKFLDTEQGRGVQEIAKMEEQRIRNPKTR